MPNTGVIESDTIVVAPKRNNQSSLPPPSMTSAWLGSPHVKGDEDTDTAYDEDDIQDEDYYPDLDRNFSNLSTDSEQMSSRTSQTQASGTSSLKQQRADRADAGLTFPFAGSQNTTVSPKYVRRPRTSARVRELDVPCARSSVSPRNSPSRSIKQTAPEPDQTRRAIKNVAKTQPISEASPEPSPADYSDMNETRAPDAAIAERTSGPLDLMRQEDAPDSDVSTYISARFLTKPRQPPPANPVTKEAIEARIAELEDIERVNTLRHKHLSSTRQRTDDTTRQRRTIEDRHIQNVRADEDKQARHVTILSLQRTTTILPSPHIIHLKAYHGNHPHNNPPPLNLLHQTLSTATLGLILGSTTYSSAAVMPSIIAAPLSTYSKLSVFDGLIQRGNAILPPRLPHRRLRPRLPLLLLRHAADVRIASDGAESGTRYGIAAAVLACAGLQVVIVPKNDAMQEIVRRGQGKGDDGVEGNERVGELPRWNWARVGLGAVAFGIAIVELAV